MTGGTSGKIVDYVLHGFRVLATPQTAGGVAPSPPIKGFPLEDCDRRLAQLLPEVNWPIDLRATDPLFLQRDTGRDDVHALADELSRLAHPAESARSTGG